MAPFTLFEIYSSDEFTELQENEKFLRFTSPEYRPDYHQRANHVSQRRTRDATPELRVFPVPFLRVSLSDRPKSVSNGWVFGSDGNTCDIIIGKHRDGISGRHFSVSPEADPGRIIIRNLSGNGTHIEEVIDGTLNYIPVRSQRGLSEAGKLTVVLNKVRLKVTTQEQQGEDFNLEWARLYADHTQGGPSLAGLNFTPAPASTQISPYILRSMIMKRPAYTIYIAEERNRHGRVVIKRYPSQEKARAEREVRLLSCFQHKHIMPFQEYDTNWGNDLVFGCFDGRVLGNEQKQQPLTYREFKVVLVQVIDALRYLHGLGFYHGGLDPESIIVRCRWPKPDVALMNFDTSINKSQADTGIRKDMDCFGQLLLHFLCGVKEPHSDVNQCERLQSASGRQVFASFRSARYDAIAAGITHAAALLFDRDFRSVLDDEVDPDNTAQLPLPMTTLLQPDQISLPDTESGDYESDIFECPKSCQKVKNRRQEVRQRVNPTRPATCTRRNRAGGRLADSRRQEGRRWQDKRHARLLSVSDATNEHIMSLETLTRPPPRRLVTRRLLLGRLNEM